MSAIHAGGVLNEGSLCGDMPEISEVKDSSLGQYREATIGQLVTCIQCQKVIDHAKKFSAIWQRLK